MLPLFVLAVVLLLRYSSVESRCQQDPCTILTFDTSNCTKWKDVAHLNTDPVSYESAESRITARFDHNTTNGQHHYVFCYKYHFHWMPRTIDCVHGKTSASVNFNWPLIGHADLLVMIYNASRYNEKAFQACATTNISIAGNYGLNLSVELTVSSGEEQEAQHGTLEQLGCILFVPTVSIRNSNFTNLKQVYYSYDFGDGFHKEDSTEPNTTHCYNKTCLAGTRYSVNAIAVSEVVSLHTNVTEDMKLLDPCSALNFDYSNCTEWNDIAFLATDLVSYVYGESEITASYDHNTTNGQHHYDFCYTNLNFHQHYPQTIGCVDSNTSASVNFSWPSNGYADLLVMIYNASSSFLACATTNISIAENGGLMLSVELTGCSEVVQVLHGTPQYTVGCIVFVPTVSQTKFNNSVIEQVYYSYDFGDGQYKQDSTEPNITHCYNKTGTYNYSVNAIGVFMTELLSLHTNLTDHMELLEEVDQISMVVNGDNSVIVDSTAPVTISAKGSVPITACWNITPSSNTSMPIYPVNTCKFQQCHQLNSTSTQVMMTFNEIGQFAFVALFWNDVSYKSDVFSYSVVTGPSPVLVASSTTAVVLGVLVAVVVIILLIVGVYIPYRRYRNRLTETADFKFVDLSEGRSYWQRAKVTANLVADRVRRPSETQKTGLVNLIAMGTEGEQNDFYGSTRSIR